MNGARINLTQRQGDSGKHTDNKDEVDGQEIAPRMPVAAAFYPLLGGWACPALPEGSSSARIQKSALGMVGQKWRHERVRSRWQRRRGRRQ
uniref:Uncharacterized protein n=1 Tax=Caenorhabditis japonica TaxID=281687 RepID=A0A8R1E8M5_CAEJA